VTTASLVTQQGCRTQGVVKRRIYGGLGVNRMAGTRPGGAQTYLRACCFVPGQWSVFQRGAERGVRLSSTKTSTMTWQSWWTRKASRWARCTQRGQGGRAGGDWEVWTAFQIFVVGPGAGKVVLSSAQRISTSTVARRLVTRLAGLWTTSMHRLRPGEPSLRCLQWSGC
jgi:hypothetical protein